MSFGKKSVPDWQESFVADVRHVFKAKDLSLEQATQSIRSADGKHLLEFDLRARRGYNYDGYPGLTPKGSILKIALSDPEHADVFLFYKSCSNNGFLREEALRALRGHVGRLVCAAALIRMEDWVSQVSDVSTRLLQDLAATDSAVHFFEFLDLIAALRSRQRFGPHWDQTLEPLLLMPKWRDSRRTALSTGNATARLLAFELTWRADRDLATETLHIAVADPSPLIALWALVRLAEFDTTARQRLLREAMRSGLTSVRSDALRRYSRGGFSDLREILEAALFDRSNSVRQVAAYQLNSQFNDSALTHWRRAFDEGKCTEAVVISLGEFGDVEDVPRLRAQLRNNRGRIRASAFRGILRLGAADSLELLTAALRDESAQVVGAAINGYARGSEHLTAEALGDALSCAIGRPLRARLIGASRLLSKWDRLQFLLSRYPKTDAEGLESLDAAVSLWIVKANYSFIAPRPEQLLVIRHALETARSIRPAKFWDGLLHFL